MNTPKHLAQQAADGMGMTILDIHCLYKDLKESESDLTAQVSQILSKAESLGHELHEVWALIK